MKKALAIILIISILMTLFVGCKKEDTPMETYKPTESTEPDTSEVTIGTSEPETSEPETEPSEAPTLEIPTEIIEPAVVDPKDSKIYPYYNESVPMTILYFNGEDGFLTTFEGSEVETPLSMEVMGELIYKCDVLMQLNANEASPDYVPDVPEFELGGFKPGRNPGIFEGGQIGTIVVYKDKLLCYIVFNVWIPEANDDFTEHEVLEFTKPNGEWVHTGTYPKHTTFNYASDVYYDINPDTNAICRYKINDDLKEKEDIPYYPVMGVAGD